MSRGKTEKVRFSYPHLFEPKKFQEGQEAKYGLTCIIDKTDTTTIKTIAQAYEEAVQEGRERFGARFKPDPMIRPATSNYGVLIDCDEDTEKYDPEVYKGKYLFPLKSSTEPGVLALETGKQILTKDNRGPEIVYAGCYGKVSFSVYPYMNVRSGVSASINNVLKTEDGEPFGGKVKATDDFASEIGAMSDADLDDAI